MSTRTTLACGAIMAFTCVGCSEPVPPAAEGASIVFWRGSGTGGGTCRVQEVHQGRIGYADASELRDLRRDAEGGASINCAIGGSGTFNVDGQMSLDGMSLHVTINGIGPGTTEADPALGAISYANVPTSGKPYVSTQDEPCRFWFAPDTQQEVAAGRLWVQFGCSQIIDASSDSSCGIENNSTIALQNCDQ
jgi:hypothetical protein